MAIQTFDDGSTLETFDDGSALATDADGGVSSSPAPRDSDVVEQKTTTEEGSTSVSSVSRSMSASSETTPTETPDGNLFKGGPQLLPASEANILHNYRSWTYNWAFGAITPGALNNHKLLERDITTYQVLNSAGKGTRGVGVSTDGLNSSGTNYSDAVGLADSFNKNSPGRFDMFIDNIAVDSIIGAGTKQGGSSIATNITFDIFEPYSMNGLIEAMQTTAQAAGYSDYMKAAFALRVQFQGWKDSGDQSRPEIIPMSTRFFPITITEITVEVNESGTRYKVNSVPVPQMGLGTPNALTADIKVAGETVGEVLKNFFTAINDMVEDRTKEQTKQPGRDKYEISCPKLATVGNKQQTKAAILSKNADTANTSEIIKAKMNDELTSVNVFKMGDPAQFKNGYVAAAVPGSTATNATSNPSTGKLTPKGGTVVFASGSQIHDCIAAIVRDSSYVRDLLKTENLEKVKKGDGLVTYFTVRMESEINSEDKVNNKHFNTYRYVLEPYQMHYTRIPGQEQGEIDLKKLKQRIKRDYNYIYTGKNLDITKFSLKFDNLYFTAIPAMLGNRPAANQKAQAAGNNNLVDTKQVGSEVVTDKEKDAKGAPMAQTGVDPKQNTFEGQAKAGQVQADPYAKLAQNLHNAVLNNVDMIQGNIDILGDPYYLVTGGMGNADLDLKEPMMTVDGQAPTTQGDVFININFKNPVDIDTKTGMMDFGVAPLSFSGVYRVTTLKNSFKDGLFTQSLDIIRIPGQILGSGTEKLPASLTTNPLPGQQKIKDTAPADILKSGIRPSDFNLANLISRGLPSSGLPGALSNFTNSLLGKTSLGSVTGSVGSLLNQVSGAAGITSQVTSQLGISPVSGVNALTSGIRLSASGLGNISSIANIPAAGIASAGAAVAGIAAIANAPASLAKNVSGAISALPSANIAAVSGQASSLVNSASALTSDVTNLASKGASAVSGALGNAKNAVTNLFSSKPTVDVASVGAKLGIDPSALAGMSAEQSSKMIAQLEEVAKSVPANTDLGSLKEQGISFASLSADKLKNLPAVQPKVTAPDAIEDPALAALLEEKYGSTKKLLAGKANLSPLTDINKVTNPSGILSAGTSVLKSAQGVLGPIANANSLINNTIGSAVGLANNVGSLAQNTIQGFSPASIGLGSVESNITNITNIAQTAAPTNLGFSVTSQFGSKQVSPLAKLVSDTNILGSSRA